MGARLESGAGWWAFGGSESRFEAGWWVRKTKAKAKSAREGAKPRIAAKKSKGKGKDMKGGWGRFALWMNVVGNGGA